MKRLTLKEVILRHIQTAAKYLQGPHLFEKSAEFLKEYGDGVFFVCGGTGYGYKATIDSNLKSHGMKGHFERFNGECSYEEVQRLKGLCEQGDYQVVVGLGGGKALDAAKCVGNFTNKHVITMPTISGSDAPCSSVAVMYSASGDKVVGIEYFKKNPELVLVDSHLVANSPLKFLLAGIGDALSTYFDVRICYRHNFPSVFKNDISITAMMLSKACFEILQQYAVDAKISCENKVVSPAIEHVIEACTYLSGVGFENGGLSASHSIHDALTELPECAGLLHGYKVSFGTLCVLVMDEAPELDDFMHLSAELGLPLCLDDLNIKDNKAEKIRSIMNTAYTNKDSVYHMPPTMDREKLFATILLADSIGKTFLIRHGYKEA